MDRISKAITHCFRLLFFMQIRSGNTRGSRFSQPVQRHRGASDRGPPLFLHQVNRTQSKEAIVTTSAAGLRKCSGRMLMIDGDERYWSAAAIPSEEKESPRRGPGNAGVTTCNSGSLPGRSRTSGYSPRVHCDGVRRHLTHDPSCGGRQGV